MKPFAVIDSETDPFKFNRLPEPFIWGFYDGSNYKEFTDATVMMDYLKEKEIVVYAHNGGRFDYFFLLPWLQPWANLMVINGRLAKFKIGKCEFRDSVNILPIALSQYQKEKVDYAIFEPGERDKPHNMQIIRDYLKSDCKNLYDVILQFKEEHGDALTLAGASMKAMCRIEDMQSPKTNRLFYDTLAPYYYGGRVQCFKTGVIKKPFTVLDINSAYPYAMTEFHPYGTEIDVSGSLPKSDNEIARCFIKLRGQVHGAFPLRTSNGLHFPDTGNSFEEFTVTGWEYLAARDTGLLGRHDINCVMQTEQKIEFTRFVSHYNKAKSDAEANGDKAGRLIAKLTMNGCYGKLAADPSRYSEYTVVPPEFIDQAEAQHDWMFESELGPWACMSKPLPEEKQHYYNVATGASITGWVRAYLIRSMARVKGLLYCDTDSIACFDPGDLEIGNGLGQWKVEAQCTEGAIAGKKLYAFRQKDGNFKIASKGVKLSAKEIYSIARGNLIGTWKDEPTYSVHKPPRFVKRMVRKTA